MSIQIIHPEADQYGNSRENIFIALGEQGDYLGSAYTYPAINHHQTPDTPYLIYMSVDPAEHPDELLKQEVSRQLFDRVLLRARKLRALRPDLTARIYGEFQADQKQRDFYIGTQFEANYSIIMEASIAEGFTYNLPEEITVQPEDLHSEDRRIVYKERYDTIFITPLNLDTLAEQGRHPHFRNLSFGRDGRLLGGSTFWAADGCGYIETLYVMPEARGTGIAKVIMNYIFDYFLANGMNLARLEVWELNTCAVALYRSLGFTRVEHKTAFPGITL